MKTFFYQIKLREKTKKTYYHIAQIHLNEKHVDMEASCFVIQLFIIGVIKDGLNQRRNVHKTILLIG